VTASPARSAAGPANGARTPGPRRRDAARTRRLLLDAARHRFARDGYATTTLRDIADDAGVNVALISRYFASKEGLFAASLTAAADELRRTTGDVQLDQVPDAIAGRIAGTDASAPLDPIVMLLLRSSGDERADEIRLGVLRSYAESLATAAGWRPEDRDNDPLLLRAHLVLAAATGIMLLRASGLEPLASVPEPDLIGPLHDMVEALLSPTPRHTGEGTHPDQR
jgi:AcrR family transcriptional regulator